MKKTVTLTFSDGSPSIELPIEQGTYGTPVIDIRALSAQGYFTHDPGFTATSSCNSEVAVKPGSWVK
jgi:citrate synthase